MRNKLNIFFLILIFINFLYVLSGVIHFPLQSIDVYSIWLFKAKAFYLYGFPDQSFWHTYKYSHPQYPILLPFFSLIYKLASSANEMHILIIYPFLYIIILYLAYNFFLKLGLSKTFSLFFTYIYSMFSPPLAQAGRKHAGTADIIITLFYWIALFAIYEIVKNKSLQKI